MNVSQFCEFGSGYHPMVDPVWSVLEAANDIRDTMTVKHVGGSLMRSYEAVRQLSPTSSSFQASSASSLRRASAKIDDRGPLHGARKFPAHTKWGLGGLSSQTLCSSGVCHQGSDQQTYCQYARTGPFERIHCHRVLVECWPHYKQRPHADV
jgi:hypothetical protein